MIVLTDIITDVINGISQNAQRWLPVLTLSALSCVLLFARMVYLQNGRFAFMAWNLSLAWAQLGLAYMLQYVVRLRGWGNWQSLALTLLWLSFLPNGFYLVTDFVHLNISLPATLLFDAVLCMSYALTGLVLGCMSTFVIHNELLKKIGSKLSVTVIMAVLLLAGFAMYLGRYLGWNSWDL